MKTDEFNSPTNIFFRRIVENLDTDSKLSTPEEGTALPEIWRKFVTTLDIDDWELAGEADPEAKRKIIGNTFIDVFEVIGHMHMSEAVFAYVPESRVLMQGDMFVVEWDWHWWGDNYMNSIEYFDLDPAIDIPVHGVVLGFDEVIENINSQVTAARAFCTQNESIEVYMAGCPVNYSRD